METRSQSRAREGQSSSSPVRPLEDPEPRPSSRASGSEGDLNLSTLLGDGEASIVGRGRTSVSATSGSCDLTLVAGQVPDRGPELESSHVPVTDMDPTSLQIVTSTTMIPGPRAQTTTSGREPMATQSSYPQRPVQIPTLISEGPGMQAGPSDWPPCASEFGNVKSTAYNCYDAVEHDMCWDENIDPYHARNVTCRPIHSGRREFSAFYAPAPLTAMPHMIDRSRTFRPLDRGHGRMSRDSSCSRDSRPKSHGSSRATSRASAANFDWVKDFMKKFADDASSRERRLVE